MAINELKPKCVLCGRPHDIPDEICPGCKEKEVNQTKEHLSLMTTIRGTHPGA